MNGTGFGQALAVLTIWAMAGGAAVAQSGAAPMPVSASPAVGASAPAPACPPGAVSLPLGLEGWAQRQALAAATDRAGLAAARLEPGQAVDGRLRPAAAIRYERTPEKAPAAARETPVYGGLYAFTVAQAGEYRIALGGRAWVDVVRSGVAQASVAHGHGPACSGIRKMVDFGLQPGRYLLQLSGAETPDLPLMVARLP